MSDIQQEPSQTPPSASPAEPTPPPNPGQRALPTLRTLLPALAVLAVLVLAWQLLDTRYALHALHEDVARRFAEVDVSSREARQLARNGQDTVQSLQARLAALDNRVVDAEAQQTALERLYQDFSRSSDDRGLQEVEQAIIIAGQQLQLAGNVPAAINALQSADSKLASMGQARLQPLRRSLAQDIERLKALPLADVNGMALQIESMLGDVESLPLAFEHSPADAAKSASKQAAPRVPRTAKSPAAAASAPLAQSEASGLAEQFKRFGADLWSDFSQLVRVQRLDRPDPVLLAPAQVSYLRENLRLRLLSARLSLLQRNGRMFVTDIQQSRLLLQRYFDTDARQVATLVDSLRQMESARLVVEVPPLSETEAILRRLRLTR
jgi:uroporphyrin-III C-methyltransferase